MTTNPLSRTVHDNVRAMLNGTDQIAFHSFVSGLNHGENGDRPTSHAKRIVNDQRDLVIVCDLHGALITERYNEHIFSNLRDFADRADVILGVSNGFHEYGLGFLINCRRERSRVV